MPGNCKYCQRKTDRTCSRCSAYICVYHAKVTAVYAKDARFEQVLKMFRCPECHKKGDLPHGYRVL